MQPKKEKDSNTWVMHNIRVTDAIVDTDTKKIERLW